MVKNDSFLAIMRISFSTFVCRLNQNSFLPRLHLTKPGHCFLSSLANSANETTQNNDEKIRKILKVAIIGVPNAGKSTLINRIIGRSIFAMSRKVHTTRCIARAVMNVGKTQIVFLDTPGLVNVTEGMKHNLERSCMVDSENAFQEADVVGVLHDVSNNYTKFKLDPKILRLLYFNPKKPTFLILNKIDAMKTRLDLLDCVRMLTKHDASTNLEKESVLDWRINEATVQEIIQDETGWSHFQEVFMVSGLTGDGIGDIQIYLTKLAQPGDWIFPQNVITDQNETKVIEDTVFSKLLDSLPYDLPYTFKIELEYFDVADDGSVTSFVNIAPKKKGANKYLLRNRGAIIRKVALNVEQSLRQFYLNDVRVRLIVKDNFEKSDKEVEKKQLLHSPELLA